MTALINSGFTFTFGRTTINLAPADVKKEGPSFDLPIAIGMLAASEQLETDQLENFVMVGELALDGGVRPVKGVLSIALRARAEGRVGVFVPADNAAEAAVVAGLRVIPIRNLREAVSFLEGETKILPTKVDIGEIFAHTNDDDTDFAEVKGQESVEASVGNRRCRRSQCPADRPAGHGQIHAGQTAADDFAPAYPRRSIGDDQNSQHRRLALTGTGAGHSAAFSHAAPHRQRCRFAGRKYQSDAGRNLAGAPRRFVPGRAARVQTQRVGNDAPAARRGQGDDSRARRAR